VQDQPLTLLPGVPLPEEYWTRPINTLNREWYTIAGNWLADGKENQLTAAPGSAHIMWTKPTQAGGIIGGTNTIDLAYYEGTSYEQRFTLPIILNGVLYYNQPLNHRDFMSRDFSTMPGQEYVAVDLRTGEEIWRDDNLGIQLATVYEYYSPNQHGAQAYLWRQSGTNMTAYDPFTGALLFTLYNVPSGSDSVGPNGEYMRYVIGGPSSGRTWLALWNFSAIPTMLTGASGTNYWQWRPAGDSGRASQLPLQHNGTNGYSWNVTLPAGINGNILFTLPDRVIGGSGYGSSGASAYHEQFSIWAVKTSGDQKGQLLFNIKPKGPLANETIQFEGTMVNQAALDAGVFVARAKESRQWIGFDINTGAQLWITDPQTPWMMYTRTCHIADGKLYSGGYGGELNAYDLKTGKLLWNNTVDLANLDAPYDRYPIGGIYSVDGKVFVITAEHSLTQPYYKGWSGYVFDAETGERIWDITGYWKTGAFADGYWATYNAFDMSIYVFGKGPSQTTVSIQNDIAIEGNSVMITGNVMDISTGTKSSTIVPRFPNGLPAVSDESMTAFMEYVYMQQPKPQDTTGVQVTFEVIDANGNSYPVGTTTTDADGFYSFLYKPDITGAYTVTASFQGSESYWPSHAKTAFVVNEAAPTASPQPALNLPPTEMYVLGIGVAIIIAIAIVGALILMAVRKRA
jgi:outer membrane protein assembly factor BamB